MLVEIFVLFIQIVENNFVDNTSENRNISKYIFPSSE